jgi:NDP-sugar pyrophosphorylase family protein
MLEEGNSMNLVIVGAEENSRLRSEELDIPAHMIKVNGESLVERMIRIARQTGAEKIFYILNKDEPEFLKYLSAKNFGIPVSIIQTAKSLLHGLYALTPSLRNAPFCLTAFNTAFDEREFSDFMNYSLLQKDADGILAITRYVNDEKPLCVALNEEDTILKFSETKEGYSWAIGGLYFFSPRIFDEMEYALKTGLPGLKNYLRILITRNYLLKGFSFSRLVHVDHLSDIQTAEQFIAQEERA